MRAWIDRSMVVLTGASVIVGVAWAIDRAWQGDVTWTIVNAVTALYNRRLFRFYVATCAARDAARNSH